MRRENIQLSVSREKAVPYVQEKNVGREHGPFPENTVSPFAFLGSYTLS